MADRMAFSTRKLLALGLVLASFLETSTALASRASPQRSTSGREKISLNSNWRFQRTEHNPDGLILKLYILPSGNEFIKDASSRHERPSGNPASNVTFANADFDDSNWETITLPHDWAIKGAFYVGQNVPVGGGMGRLPIQGVGWYRREVSFSSADQGRQIYLEVDGAQSYAMVWLNGQLVGGWPYGYASFRLDLTPFVNFNGANLLAIRVDNPTESSRWYPGGGIYRNVWLTKVDTVAVSQWGTYVVTENVTTESATVKMVIQVESKSNSTQSVDIATDIHVLDPKTGSPGGKVAEFPRFTSSFNSSGKQAITQTSVVENPLLWGPWSIQTPNLYVAVTRLSSQNHTFDTYETQFGIRTFVYDGTEGLSINGQKIRIQGVNNHHDLGAIGAAFNVRAAERQLEILKEMGCNAIRMSHNPPAPELLELTDRMGFIVMDEIFDTWQKRKTRNDFHLIFNDWHEPDLRAFIRRDRNHPSIFSWSIGNEVGEQQTNETGAAVAKILHDIAHDEDPTRPVTASMNFAKPYMAFPKELDLLSLNYQGEGIYDTPPFSQLPGADTYGTPSQYKPFHETFPEKLLLSSESAAGLSTRGTYIFPVFAGTNAPVNDTSGGNSTTRQVSDYGVYAANFSSSPERVFSTQDQHPFVAGEFVWSGFDYLGEPTPYYSARSSYFGPIDLAGFPKDRYYLYQTRWVPDLKSAHILPHWTWPDRVGQVTPVHVFSSGDEAELFLNGRSLGRQKKAEFSYRFRWDEVVYEPGELRVVTYKNGTEWANATKRTVGPAASLRVSADRTSIAADGLDLSFVKVEVLDKDENMVPEASNSITFAVEGAGELVATDNGFPADFTPFPEKTRNAFNGLALGIIARSFWRHLKRT
ncbi:glycoside hydrolase family 2 sugar binding protein [Byssothecium circinans]|uniref:Glycoside hydrolase family 2 sugar binding protein n=1 Tax=Byssothecium circinans TaxID=147558 RepID=A0A6A5U879_9PLEO|nr:glycoside hydrolase family 2 sugar binding protein [Byssothecium circinans]